MELPASVGKYELIEFLGGEMSLVYRARDTEFDRIVIVKLLNEESAADPESKTRFLEHDAASMLDSGEYHGRPYIVTEVLKSVRARESPARSILRLSMIVYGLVLFVTVLAVWFWFAERKAADVPIAPSPRGVAGVARSSMMLVPGFTSAGTATKPFFIDTAPVTSMDFCAVIHCTNPMPEPGAPAVNMTMAQAREYAKYKGKRLPTLSEWKRAASLNNAAYRGLGTIWELVESPVDSGAEALSISGGVVQPPRPIPLGSSAPDIGFRCVKDP
jgi:hypothetical protein